MEALFIHYGVQDKLIFMPFTNEDSKLFKYLKSKGYNVHAKFHDDFFDSTVDEINQLHEDGFIIFDNPPFSLRTKICKLLFKTNIKFYLFSSCSSYKYNLSFDFIGNIYYHNEKNSGILTCICTNSHYNKLNNISDKFKDYHYKPLTKAKTNRKPYEKACIEIQTLKGEVEYETIQYYESGIKIFGGGFKIKE
jgi:hypothetical protein